MIAYLEMEEGVQRWVVDISNWDPTPQDFSFALSLLPQHQHSSISRYKKIEDRKRALVSRLLQYTLVHQVLGLPLDDITISRTNEGKPYLECDKVNMGFPNFNFNVSHHGDYVAIASEPLCIVGLDIVSCTVPCREPILEFVQNFSLYFSTFEWDNIVNAGSSEEILVEFYRFIIGPKKRFIGFPHIQYWSLKEAYVKAIGIGMGYGLENVEFHHTGWRDVSVKVAGQTMTEWNFWLFELEKRHWVSVAKGHPRSATESYKRTLRRSDFNDEEYKKGIRLPNASFLTKTVEHLVSILCKAHGKLDT